VAYMSPEQARGRTVDHRSDIFSLGATIYEMATGRLPFGGESPLDTMHAIAFEETRPVTEFRQNVPPGLQKIVTRCLRKRVEDRYQDARTLVEDLKELKREIDSGITRSASLHERIRDRFDSFTFLKDRSTLLTTVGIALAAAAVAALVWTGKFWSVFFLGLAAWLVYRKLSTRQRRLARRFAAKVCRFPEVRLISFRENKATVIVDHLHAKTYLRINSLMESVNNKFHLGGPMTATVRDDVPEDEFRRMLREPGVLYLRDDVKLDAPPPSPPAGKDLIS
jgi:serine/threonine protein kinase